MSLPFAPHLAYIGPGAGFAFLGQFSYAAWRTPPRLHLRAPVAVPCRLGRAGRPPGIQERQNQETDLPRPRRPRPLASPSDTWPKANSRISAAFARWVVSIACALPSPPLSPVAWTTFATGVNPARHNMFDFLNRNLRSYMPELSSSRVREPERILSIGKYRIPLSRPLVEMRRKSRTFWQILGEHQIASTILRVPITFPPEKFNGRMLSAMCTPDLLGTQGTFALYTTRTARRIHGRAAIDSPLDADGTDSITAQIEGPENRIEEGAGPMTIPFTSAEARPRRPLLSRSRANATNSHSASTRPGSL